MASQILASLDPSILRELPAMTPPKGVTSNFVDPYSAGPIFIVVGSILIGIMMLFVAVRVYTKAHITRKVHWDDLTCLLATLGAIAYFIDSIYIVKANVGVHLWNVRLVDFLNRRFLLPAYLTIVLPPPLMLVTKITFFILYLQLFQPIKALRIGIYAGMFMTCGFYGAMTIAQLVYQTPQRGETLLTHSTSKLAEGSLRASVPQSAFGVFIDLYIFILPIVAISQLHLAKRRKIGLCLVFGTGSIACLSSILSLYFRVKLNHSKDYTWATFPVILCALVEICVGVICACMPSVSCLFRHHLPAIEIWRSHLASRYQSFRHLLSRRTRGGSSASDVESGKTLQGSELNQVPYSNLESKATRSKPLPALKSRLGQMETLRNYISGSGGQKTKNDTVDEVIGSYGTHDEDQGWQNRTPRCVLEDAKA